MTTVEVGSSASTRAVSRADLSGATANAAQKIPVAARQTDKKPSEPVPCISPEERFLLISEAAYFRAEQRGFMAGDDLTDWLAAETEVDALLLGDEALQSSR